MGVKEATGDMSQCSLIMEQCPKGFSLLSGDDFTALPLMSIGGSGVISVYANVMPAMCHQIVDDYLHGRQASTMTSSSCIRPCSWKATPSRSRPPWLSWAA